MQEVSRVPDELDDILGMIGTDASGAPVSRPEGGTSVSRSGAERNLRAGRGGVGGGNDAAQRMLASELRAGEEIIALLQEAAGIHDEVSDVLHEVGTIADEAIEQAHAIDTIKVRMHEARMQEIDDEAARQREEFEQYVADLQKERQLAQERRAHLIDTVEAGGQAFDMMSGLMGQIGSIMEKQGEGIEGVKEAQGAFLIAYNVVMGATEIARAAGSYPDVLGMITHGIAATSHFAAAGIAAAQLGGGSANTAGAASAAGTFRPAAPERTESNEREPGGVNIYKQYYLSENMAQLGVAAERGRYEMRRQNTEAGLPNVGWDV
jgi:hypothetical protein